MAGIFALFTAIGFGRHLHDRPVPQRLHNFSADGYVLQISNERLANIIEKLSQPEQRLLILRFVLELNDREIWQEDALFQKRHPMPPHKCFAKSTETTDVGTAMKKLNGKVHASATSICYQGSPRRGGPMRWNRFWQHYDAYINKLCLRTMVDESGQPHKQVDSYMKGQFTK
mgnify:CR=1 FL=1